MMFLQQKLISMLGNEAVTAGLRCAHSSVFLKVQQCLKEPNAAWKSCIVKALTCSLKFAPPSTLDMGITMTSELPDDIRLTEGVCSSRACMRHMNSVVSPCGLTANEGVPPEPICSWLHLHSTACAIPRPGMQSCGTHAAEGMPSSRCRPWQDCSAQHAQIQEPAAQRMQLHLQWQAVAALDNLP